MFKNIEQIYKTLILINCFISVVITLKIFIRNNYTFSEMSMGLLVTIIYGSIWFFSLYKIYNFSKIGLRIYISLTFLGFIFNILSNLSYLDKTIYIFTLTEHIIIGSILTFAYFSKIKSKFK